MSDTTSHAHPSRTGFTLVEILVALFVFAIVAALAGNGIVQSLRMQQMNEAHTGLQGKLRRITEVISQDLRSSVLGGLASLPYTSVGSSVSFSLADGGQGFQVAEDGFGAGGSKRIYANNTTGIANRRILVVNGAGDAIVYNSTNVQSLGGNRHQVNHNSCSGSSIPYVAPVRMFVVESTGYSFNSATGTLSRQVMRGTTDPVAFGLSSFVVAYSYRGNDDSLVNRATPYMSGTIPLRVYLDPGSGIEYTLESLRVTIAAEETIAGGQVVERNYVSQIAMPPTGSVNLRSVVSCS